MPAPDDASGFLERDEISLYLEKSFLSTEDDKTLDFFKDMSQKFDFSFNPVVAAKPLPEPIQTNATIACQMSARPSTVFQSPVVSMHSEDDSTPSPFSPTPAIVAESGFSASSTAALETMLVDLPSPATQDDTMKVVAEYSDGFALLLHRAKEGIQSAKEAALFLNIRAKNDEDYAKLMAKLAAGASKTDGKNGMYHSAWASVGGVHGRLAELKLQFALSIRQISDDIQVLQKNTERSRKQLKDGLTKYQKELQDSESSLEKARLKNENANDELNKSQSNENIPQRQEISEGRKLMLNFIKRNKRTEEDFKEKASQTHESYRAQLQETNAIRKRFYSTHLPQFVRALKETIDDCDTGLESYLTKFALRMENTMLDEAKTLCPDNNDDSGLAATFRNVNLKADFNEFAMAIMKKSPTDKKSSQLINEATRKGSGKNIAPKETHSNVRLTSLPNLIAKQTSGDEINRTSRTSWNFGSSIEDIVSREKLDVPVPIVVSNLIGYLDIHGINQEGIYRLSGSGTEVNKLKMALDRDASSNIPSLIMDCHTAAVLLKLFFRELTDPLFPKSMFAQLIDAGRMQDERLRLIQIHELINELPDPNYATLRLLGKHLYMISINSEINKMGVTNLSIVWGPTLIDSQGAPDPMEMKYSSQVIEVVLQNYNQIFES